MKTLKNIVARLTTLTVMVSLVIMTAPTADAAALTNASVSVTRHKVSTAAQFTVQFTLPAGVALTGGTSRILLTPRSGFDFSTASGAAASIFINGTGATTASGATSTGVITTAGSGLVLAVSGSITAAATVTMTGAGLTFTGSTAGTHIIDLKVASDGTNYNDATAVALSVVADDQVAVTATVDPTLTLTMGANAIALGTLSVSATNTGSHTVRVATNAAAGYSLSITGNTLTSTSSGTVTIPGITTAGGSGTIVGTSRFGINLVANASSLGVGANPTAAFGSTGTVATNFIGADKFYFNAGGNTLATNNTAADVTYTVSYVADIAAAQPAGNYSTALTYTVTATF